MQTIRTPDDRFANLEDYPFQPNYVNVNDTEGGQLRIHYVDEGPRDAPIVLLMHGQPVWSYLYRFMIPLLVKEGFRVIAPDLVGFGRSDKPTARQDYTYARHVSWMSDWLTQLDLKDITVFFQDWGSLIGLRLVAAFPDRFSHVVLSNGGLPAGVIPALPSKFFNWVYPRLSVVRADELGAKFRRKIGIPGFFYWRKYAAESPDFSIGDVLQVTTKATLSDAAIAGYEAPFPDQSYMAGARQFPTLVPIMFNEPEVPENKAAWRELRKFDKPFMCAFSDNDPVTAGLDQQFKDRIPGAQGVDHRTITDAGHFVQQDQPEKCVQAILDVRK
ncbi:MAG: haloalkane dehalogenase [Gammaproteobacteria bacterium]|nr:haloalkane dehalogenase [Gammaproteobacteria bacterium]